MQNDGNARRYTSNEDKPRSSKLPHKNEVTKNEETNKREFVRNIIKCIMLKYKSQTEKPHEDIRNTVNAQEVKDIQNTSKSNAHRLQLNTDIYTSIMKKKPKRYTARMNEADPLTTKERDENIKNDVLNKLIKHFDRNSVKNTIETEQNTEENLNADNKKTDPNVDNISRKDKLATEKKHKRIL